MPLIDLSALLPRAIAWAEARAQEALSHGKSPDDELRSIAAGVGVRCPDRIRIVTVDRFPSPEDPELRQAAMATGLLGADGLGLTLGYAVFLRKGHETDPRLLRHEFTHVQQCEQMGSLAAFLSEYLSQVVRVGYHRAPLEEDARVHEVKAK